jgi:hypothetical protein
MLERRSDSTMVALERRLVHLAAPPDRTRSESAVLNRNSADCDLQTARSHRKSEGWSNYDA